MAKHLNLSVSTVSRCLNNYPDVNPETRKRIFDAIEQLNYVPNASARNITRQRTRTIGLTIPDIQDPFFSASADAVEFVCRREGYEIIYGNLGRSSARLIDFLTRSAEMRLDGMIITPDDWNPDLLRVLSRMQMPIVSLRRRPPEGVDIPYVDADHYEGARLLVEHLVAKGHRRIGHIAHPTALGRERLIGYGDVLREHYLEPRVIETGTPWGRLADSIQKGRTAMAELLALYPDTTAVFAASDLLAMGAMEHCAKAGVRVPEDVSIGGFDNLEYADFYWFRLTTMALDRWELGRLAGSMLLGMITGEETRPKPVLLRTRLTERDSVAKIGEDRQ